MAIVRLSFDAGNVPVVTGDIPPDDQTPILDAVLTGFTTNEAFIVRQGIYRFGLQTEAPPTPLWQVVQAVDREEAEILFREQ